MTADSSPDSLHDRYYMSDHHERTERRGQQGQRGIIKSVVIATKRILYVRGICRMETATHVWGDALDDWDQEDIQEQGDGQEARES